MSKISKLNIKEGRMDIQGKACFAVRRECESAALAEFVEPLKAAAEAVFRGRKFELRSYPQSFSVYRGGVKGAREIALRLSPDGRGVELVKSIIQPGENARVSSEVIRGRIAVRKELKRLTEKGAVK